MLLSQQPTTKIVTKQDALILIQSIKLGIDTLGKTALSLRKKIAHLYALRAWHVLGYQNANELFENEFGATLTAWWRQLNTAVFEMHVLGDMPLELVDKLKSSKDPLSEEQMETVLAALTSVGELSQRGVRALIEGSGKVSPEQWSNAYSYATQNGQQLTQSTGKEAAEKIAVKQVASSIYPISPLTASMVESGEISSAVGQEIAQLVLESDPRIAQIVNLYGLTDAKVIPTLNRLAKRGGAGSGRESDTLQTILATGTLDGSDDTVIRHITAEDLERHLREKSFEYRMVGVQVAADRSVHQANQLGAAHFTSSLESFGDMGQGALGVLVPCDVPPEQIGDYMKRRQLHVLAVIAYRGEKGASPQINVTKSRRLPAGYLGGRIPEFLRHAVRDALLPPEQAALVADMQTLFEEDPQFLQEIISAAKTPELKEKIKELVAC